MILVEQVWRSLHDSLVREVAFFSQFFDVVESSVSNFLCVFYTTEQLQIVINLVITWSKGARYDGLLIIHDLTRELMKVPQLDFAQKPPISLFIHKKNMSTMKNTETGFSYQETVLRLVPTDPTESFQARCQMVPPHVGRLLGV